jgi:hypothetical protein
VGQHAIVAQQCPHGASAGVRVTDVDTALDGRVGVDDNDAGVATDTDSRTEPVTARLTPPLAASDLGQSAAMQLNRRDSTFFLVPHTHAHTYKRTHIHVHTPRSRDLTDGTKSGQKYPKHCIVDSCGGSQRRS